MQVVQPSAGAQRYLSTVMGASGPSSSQFPGDTQGNWVPERQTGLPEVAKRGL